MAKKPRPETFADLLLRLAPEETNEAFAKRAKVGVSTVQRLLAGEIAEPRRVTLARLATALGCDHATVRAAVLASREGK